MKGKVLGLKRKGPKSLHKTTKQISKTKVMSKFASDKSEFTFMLEPQIGDELRDLKIRNNMSYQDLILVMIALFRKEQKRLKEEE
jgi:hypothetical protein